MRRKLYRLLPLCLVCTGMVLFSSCDAVLQGMAMGMGGYGMGGYGMGNAFQYAPATYGSVSSVGSSTVSSGSSSGSTSGSTASKVCRTCHGDGKCLSCHGSGVRTDNYYGTGKDYSKKCGVCGGSGTCGVCRGTGHVK